MLGDNSWEIGIDYRNWHYYAVFGELDCPKPPWWGSAWNAYYDRPSF